MTSPTQSAMEQQQREDALSDERILRLWDEHVGYESGTRAATKMPLSSQDKLLFARAVLAASELRSLRDSLALARSRIAELEGEPRFSADDVDAAAEHCGISDGYRDMLAGALRYMALRAALNKEQP